MEFASDSSYRRTAWTFNRVRHSPQPAYTPMTTIAAIVARDGIAVQEYLHRFVTTVLAQHDFTPEGVPQPATYPTYQRPLAEALHAARRLSRETVTQTRDEYNANQAPDLQIPASAVDTIYEDLPGAVNISLDDVGVTKQKVHRKARDHRRQSREFLLNLGAGGTSA